MRQPAIRFVYLFALALLVGSLAPRAAWADARSEAKVHYQAGVKAYAGSDYRTAIKEFSAAQQLAPADLNNYNLALCYDKLGEAEPAIQYYKEYLAKVPNSDKRTEIEGSVSRLEGALQSAAAKRAEEAKRSEEARKAEQARLDDEVRKAAEAKRLEDAKQGATTVPDGAVPTTVPPTGGASTDTSVGSSGTPGTGQVVSTGDAQLDRASSIDINAVRDQRAGMGTNDPRPGAGPQSVQGAGGGPQGAGVGAGVGPQANSNPQNRGGSPDQSVPADQPKKETPVYKKWWFWAVVVVSAVVVYQIVSTDSSPRSQARQGLDARPIQAPPETAGIPLLSW